MELQFWCITIDLVPEICLKDLDFLVFSTTRDFIRRSVSINWFLDMAQIVGWRKYAHITNTAGRWFYIFVDFHEMIQFDDQQISKGLLQSATSLVKTVKVHSPRADRYKWSDRGSPQKWPNING